MCAVSYRLWLDYMELGTHILGPQLEQLNAEAANDHESTPTPNPHTLPFTVSRCQNV